MTDCVIVQPIAPCGVQLLQDAGLSVFEAQSTGSGSPETPSQDRKSGDHRDTGFSAEAIDVTPNLKIIASHGTGTDSIDKPRLNGAVSRWSARPDRMRNLSPNMRSPLMLACARRITAADDAVRAGDWSFRERTRPQEISGRRLGLIGYGHVARRLATLAQRLGMTVMVLSKHASEAELSADGNLRASSLEELLATAEVVSLHGLPDHTPVLGAALLSNLRADAILINTARGALIDEAALADALLGGRIAAAGLDVFSSEPLPHDSRLLDCPNLILTPHIGGSGVEALERTALEVARKVVEGLGIAVPR